MPLAVDLDFGHLPGPLGNVGPDRNESLVADGEAKVDHWVQILPGLDQGFEVGVRSRRINVTGGFGETLELHLPRPVAAAPSGALFDGSGIIGHRDLVPLEIIVGKAGLPEQLWSWLWLLHRSDSGRVV